MAARAPLSLKARALQWLAQREHSRIELQRKLLRAARRRDAEEASESADAAAIDPGPEVEALLDWLAANRYLSEARFVESRVHARSSRFGNRRIVQELAQHGAELDVGTAEQLKASELGRARAVWQRKFGAAPAADAQARAKQMRFNQERGIVPRGVHKQVRELIDGVYESGPTRAELRAASEVADYEVMNEKQIAREIKRLEKLMFEHAKNLEFEKAARVRDQLAALKERVFGAGGTGNVVPAVVAEKAA